MLPSWAQVRALEEASEPDRLRPGRGACSCKWQVQLSLTRLSRQAFVSLHVAVEDPIEMALKGAFAWRLAPRRGGAV